MGSSKNVAIFLLVDIVCITLGVYAVTAGDRQLLAVRDRRDAIADGKEELHGLLDSIWGRSCLLDKQCADFVGRCDRSQGVVAVLSLGQLRADGECRPSIWGWIMVAVILVLFLASCISCIYCGRC